MAFNKKTWKARIAEHPARRILKFVLTGVESVVEVARDEGAVAQDGDAFSAGNMNDLEQRIADGFDNVPATSVKAGMFGGKVVANFDAASDLLVVQVRNSIGTNVDPGKNVAVDYPDGTEINVYE